MLDESIVGELFASLEPHKRLSVLGGYTQGGRHLYTATGPIETPEDLAGMKIRVQESEIFLRLITNMGGVPTPMAYSEVYTGLQAGVLDGAENNEISYVTQRHYEVAKHFTMTNHLVGFDFLLANTDLLEEMDEADSDAVREAWALTQSEFVEIWKQQTADAVQEMLDRGVGGLLLPDLDELALGETQASRTASALASSISSRRSVLASRKSKPTRMGFG